MNELILEIFKRSVLYQTERLIIKNWISLEQTAKSKKNLFENVTRIMTPNVTKDLPAGWQNILTFDEAEKWVAARKNDSNFYAIQLLEHSEIIGLLFLYQEDEATEFTELRLGYLLAESVWGKGIGSELINGLVNLCKNKKAIISLSGGVERNNIGSIRVLEKNRFRRIEAELPDNMLLYKLIVNK